MILEKFYSYKDLSKKVKQKVCKEYLKGWLETHDDDDLCLDEVDKLLITSDNDCYLEDGTLIGDFD